MVWEGRVYGLIDSLKLIFQCSSLEEKVDATWIMFSTLGISNPQQKPSKFPDFSEILKTIIFCQHLLLSQNVSSLARWGFFSLLGGGTHTQNSTPVFLLTRRAHQCHKLLWERWLLELTGIKFHDSHLITSTFSFKNRNTLQTEERLEDRIVKSVHKGGVPSHQELVFSMNACFSSARLHVWCSRCLAG